MSEKIIETKICKMCSESFDITQGDKDFLDTLSPLIGGKKFQIPLPTLCPKCRQQRRLSFKNERNLYKRKCSATGKEIISIYSPDKNVAVYEQDFWWSDAWTMNFSLPAFDFSKTFFEQFAQLHKKIPKRALVRGTGSENCDYTNMIGASKDAYFIFDGMKSESCLYLQSFSDTICCVDCSNIRKSEHCYGCVDVKDSYKCFFSQNTYSCRNSFYLRNCMNCEYCFGCVGLENKKYYVLNQEYSKQEYFKKIKELQDKGFSLEIFQDFSNTFSLDHSEIVASENALGDKIYNSRNIYMSYDIYDGEDIRHSAQVYNQAHTIMDGDVCINGSSYLYEMSLANKESSQMLFSYDCWNHCEKLIYCMECKKTKNCFACSGLVDREYCIFNKQYTKESYEKLVSEIIDHMQKTGEWGEFFPSSLSIFGYNETVAQDYYPMDESEVLERGWIWSEYQNPSPKVDKIIPAKNLPDNIQDIPDDILNWAIECELSQKAFRIIKQELEFYRRHNLPVPRKHPNERFLERFNTRKHYG